MEKVDVENQPCIPRTSETRLVLGNKFRIRRHHLSGWLFARDLYHTLLSLHSIWIFLTLVGMYFAIAVFFAALYFAIIAPGPAATDMSTFGRAFVASLQIQSTIGFASPTRDHWTKNWKVSAVITMQSLATVLFNIFLLGTLFSRLSSAKNRAMSVRISSSVVLREEEGGYPFIEFRVGEVRKHQLLNLNVSAHLFYHQDEKLFQRERLALVPTGGIFLAIPTEIRHVIDETSPLWKLLAGSDSSLSSYDCTACGDSFESKEQLARHLDFILSKSNDPKHSMCLKASLSVPRPTFDSVKSHMRLSESYWEIIIMIEGTEPVTGSPIQVRHSFTIHDMLFDVRFRKCWRVSTGDGFLGGQKTIVVNFDDFDLVE